MNAQATSLDNHPISIRYQSENLLVSSRRESYFRHSPTRYYRGDFNAPLIKYTAGVRDTGSPVSLSGIFSPRRTVRYQFLFLSNLNADTIDLRFAHSNFRTESDFTIDPGRDDPSDADSYADFLALTRTTSSITVMVVTALKSGLGRHRMV